MCSRVRRPETSTHNIIAETGISDVRLVHTERCGATMLLGLRATTGS